MKTPVHINRLKSYTPRILQRTSTDTSESTLTEDHTTDMVQPPIFNTPSIDNLQIEAQVDQINTDQPGISTSYSIPEISSTSDEQQDVIVNEEIIDESSNIDTSKEEEKEEIQHLEPEIPKSLKGLYNALEDINENIKRKLNPNIGRTKNRLILCHGLQYISGGDRQKYFKKKIPQLKNPDQLKKFINECKDNFDSVFYHEINKHRLLS